MRNSLRNILILQKIRLDPDAVAFAAASGATDVVNISKFVKGVKALGLWSSMVCWPMRSSQNAGSGTTVYSLGGLGSNNGTLVNGPTWGADGIILGATNHCMTTGFTVQPAATAGAVFNTSSVTATSAFFGFQTGRMDTRTNSGASSIVSTYLSGATSSGVQSANQTNFIASTISAANSASQFINGTQGAAGTVTPGTFETFVLGFNGVVNTHLGTCAFAFALNQNINLATNNSIRDIIRLTLTPSLL
jgi:hypothetical protein